MSPTRRRISAWALGSVLLTGALWLTPLAPVSAEEGPIGGAPAEQAPAKRTPVDPSAPVRWSSDVEASVARAQQSGRMLAVLFR